jgi:hypothetical protein
MLWKVFVFYREWPPARFCEKRGRNRLHPQSTYPLPTVGIRWYIPYSFDSLLRLNFIMAESTAKTLKFHHEDTKSQSSLFIMLVSPCLCDSIFAFLQ